MVAAMALILSIAALVLSAVAYWRAGGRRDLENALAQLRSAVDALEARERELARDLYESIRYGYQGTRRAIERARARLAELKEQAVGGMEKQLETAAEHLRKLEKRVEQHLSKLGRSAISAARDAEYALSQRARKLEARAEILVVKAHLLRARSLSERKELDRAEDLLKRAVSSLEEARRILGRDDDDAPAIEAVVRSLRDAIAAIRNEAEGARRRMEKILADTDALVASLEGFEDDAEQRELFEERRPVAAQQQTAPVTSEDSISSGGAERRAAVR
jgi:hypothetical protein